MTSRELYSSRLPHWNTLFQLFCPVQHDVDLLPWSGTAGVGSSIFDHQEALAIGSDGVLQAGLWRQVFSLEEGLRRPGLKR